MRAMDAMAIQRRSVEGRSNECEWRTAVKLTAREARLEAIVLTIWSRRRATRYSVRRTSTKALDCSCHFVNQLTCPCSESTDGHEIARAVILAPATFLDPTRIAIRR